MVRNALSPAIQRVERITSVRRGYDPFVMRLVESLVDHRVVQSTVNPVDAKVRKRDKQRILDVVVERIRGLCREIVELGESLRFGHEEWSCQGGHDGHCAQCLPNLHRDLIAQELGVLHRSMVIYEVVGDSCAEEIKE